MKEMKRILAIFLCLVMLVGVMPVSAFATEDLGGFFIPGGDKAASEDGSLGGFVIPGGKVEAEETTAPAEEETTAPAEEETTAPSTEPATEPTVATEEVEEEEAEQLDADGVTYVLAGSDFQPTDGKTSTGVNLVNQILNQVNEDYDTMDGFLFMGDYDYNYSASAAGKAALQGAVQAVYGTGMHEVYVEGNHDCASRQGVDLVANGTLSSSGANDAEDYGVYVIHERDYMWASNGINPTTIQKTADNLEAYLNAKRNAKYTKPIFVISHLPLHYSMRTANDGDGSHANYIFDVLNEAGNAGLNIIFMFGHNHSNGWDDYLGGAAIYLAKGDKINIAQASKTVFEEETLAFTYLNAGYVAYYRNVNTGSETDLTMTVFEITDTEVQVSRYSAGGLHDVKSEGVTNSYKNETAYDPNTTVYESPQTIKLNTEITPAGEEVEAPDSGNTGSGTATQRTYTRVTSTSELVSGGKYLIFYDGSHFMLPEVVEKSDGSVRKGFNIESTSICGPDTISGDYSAKEWVLTSSGSGWLLGNGTQYAKLTNTSNYKVTATLETSGDTFTIGGSENAFTFSNGTYVFNYNDRGLINGYASDAATFYIYRMTDEGSSGGNVETSGGNWVTITEPTAAGYKYELDTNGVDTGVEYLIVANSYAKALSAAASSNNAVDITIDGNYAYASSDTYGWTFTSYSNGVYYIRLNGSTYLRLNNGSLASSTSTGSSRRWTVTNNNDGSYDIIRDNYNLRWSNSNGVFQASSSNEGPVRLYKYVGTTTAQAGLYGKVSGELTYYVANGTSEADALAAVKAGIDILYHNGDESAAQIFPDDGEGMTWNIENYNGAVGGEYAVTIAYNGVTLGTAKVVVPSVNITGYSVEPSVGTVSKGASQTAESGALIYVQLENGKYYTVPVTVGMLTKADGSAVSTGEMGTYENLVLKYNGVTITENFTLNVVAKTGNNYPEYPNEGAVKVGKTGTGVDFQASGIAQVEISASGVPMKKGADVIVMLDLSSSMTNTVDGKTRLSVLEASIQSLMTQLKANGKDGLPMDIRIAVADFHRYYPDSSSLYYINSEDHLINGSIRTSADGTNMVYTGTGALNAGAFVSVHDLAVNEFSGLSTKSGTNYDYAFDAIYQLGEAITAQNAVDGEDRDLFVIFMSDGAPFQFNYFSAQSGNSSGSTDARYWNNWLQGTMTDAMFDSNARNDYYNEDGKHWMAEAIKGDPATTYPVIRKNNAADTDGDTWVNVNGLGAKMYSIGFCLAVDKEITVNSMDTVIRNIASSEQYYFRANSAADLSSAFTSIGGDIAYAAYNARFVDQMGDDYDLQLKTSTYEVRNEDNSFTEKTLAPVIEVLNYDIYTKAEADAGQIPTGKNIGDRKGTYTLKEVVKFSDDGSKAYSNLIDKDNDGVYGVTVNADGTYTISDTDDNIIDANGVICSTTFWYNTTSEGIAIDGVSIPTGTTTGTITTGSTNVLPAETFYWKMGTVQTSELAMRYYVFLTDSMDEPGKAAGSYPTNEYATLYYDNYLENPCKKDTVSPVLAWEAANVSYAFYLVNSDGQPVNMNGEVVPFAERVIIVNPTIHAEVKLNTSEDIDPLKVISGDVLPDGYALYDEGAQYTVTVNSNGSGSWEITQTETPATTYVTDYSASEQYTNETNVAHTDHDYTHTTVWFAVKWEPQALPDTVVIDYGLPVDIHVMANDMFGDYGKLVGVAAGDKLDEVTSSTNGVTTTSATGTFGSAKVQVPASGANASNSVVRYELNKDADLTMNDAEVFTYSVKYANTNYEQNNGYYYSTITVIPATTIYYEDDFVDLSTYTWDGGWVENEESGWTPVTDDTYVEGEDITQDEDRPDDVNYAFDTIIDADNVYGYDSSYTECSKYSLGSAAKATVDYNNKAEASFTFYGTGFDVISLTNSDTGTIIVDVYEVDTNEKKHSYVVDTYYGYVMTENKNQTEENPGKWEFELKRDASGLYQVPVIKVSGLTYGQYKAVITAQYSTPFDHEKDGSYDFYLDAIRIYDPAGVVSGEDNDVIQDAYVKDDEAYPVYQELRNNILNKSDVKNGIPGAVFIDGIGVTASVENYKEYGPNNEVYLNPGQAILFTTNLGSAADKLASLQIGLKAETQTAATYYIFDAATVKASADLQNLKPDTVATATDMYYDITALAGKNIVIYNSGDGILSITNLKATFTADSGLTEILDIVEDADIENFLNALNDGESDTGSDSGTDTNLAEVIKSIVGRLKSLFGKG